MANGECGGRMRRLGAWRICCGWIAVLAWALAVASPLAAAETRDALRPPLYRLAENEAGLVYRVYLGGFRVGGFELGASTRAPTEAEEVVSYGLRMRAWLAGHAARLFYLEFHTRSRGIVTSEGARSEAFWFWNRWGRTGRVRARSFFHERGEGAEVFRADAGVVIPEGYAERQLDVATDPMSLLADFVLQTGIRDDTLTAWSPAISAAPLFGDDLLRWCAPARDVFDGKRVFRITPVSATADTRDFGRYSPFGGKLVHCEYAMEGLAGFRGEARRARFPESLMVSSVPLTDAGLLVPVQISFRTSLGRFIAYLVEVRAPASFGSR